jgi:hypothetical protein
MRLDVFFNVLFINHTNHRTTAAPSSTSPWATLASTPMVD